MKDTVERHDKDCHKDAFEVLNQLQSSGEINLQSLKFSARFIVEKIVEQNQVSNLYLCKGRKQYHQVFAVLQVLA